MVKRKRGERPTAAQSEATINNLILANLVRQQHLFALNGHHDFEKLAEDLEAKFRAKLLETKK